MTKKTLLSALEGVPEDAQVFVCNKIELENCDDDNPANVLRAIGVEIAPVCPPEDVDDLEKNIPDSIVIAFL